jgi:hypothetical protein
MGVVVKRSGRQSYAAALLASLWLVAASGCAGPTWFSSSGDGDFPVNDPYAARVYPKARATQASKPTSERPQNPQRQSAARPLPQENSADVQRQKAIEEQLAAYQKYVQAKSSDTASQQAAAPEKPQSQVFAEPVALAPPAPQRLPSIADESPEAATPTPPQQPSADEPQIAASMSKKESSAAKASAKEATPAVAEQPAQEAKETVITAVARAQDSPAVKPASLEKPVGDESPSPSDRSAKQPEAAEYQSGDWLGQRDRLIAAIQEEIAIAKQDSARAEEVRQLETVLRMQYALAGKREEAAKPIEGLRDAEQEFWRSEAFGLVDLLGPDRLPSESRRYAVALKSLEEAELHLASASSLALRNLAVCRKVQDFGVIERFSKNDFTPNQEVLLYVEVANFAAHKRDDRTYETELQGSFRVLDRSGAARAERTLPLDKQTCANLRRDYYIAYRLYIPSELAPGAYTLELTIEDKKGNKSNNALLDFNVTQ